MKIFKSWFTKKQTKIKGSKVSQEMNKSLKKYDETYKLLEEYDRRSIKDPKVLADPGRLQGAISRLQRSSSS